MPKQKNAVKKVISCTDCVEGKGRKDLKPPKRPARCWLDDRACPNDAKAMEQPD